MAPLEERAVWQWSVKEVAEGAVHYFTCFYLGEI